MNYLPRFFKDETDLDNWLWKHPKVRLVSVYEKEQGGICAWIAYDEEADL